MTKSQTPNPKLVIGHWSLVIAVPLLTWALRLCCLETVPPGWRDDELINIHALSGELLAGHFPLYFTGASGHEPLYHYLHAAIHAVLGFNVLSGHLLSVACGTLTVALTYVLTRRLFGFATAAIASLALATSFWSLMYSRVAIRHISLVPLALATFRLLPIYQSTKYQSTHPGKLVDWEMVNWALAGLLLAVSLYTYPAARLLPVVLVVLAAYLALFHHDLFRRHRRGFLLALGIVGLLAVPLSVAIAQGISEAAVQGIGADARLAELAVPLRELRAGNLRPLLQSTLITAGMFHTTGDPEWLYNLPGRPVFGPLGAVLFWAGVALCLWRWRRPRYALMLIWLGLGLLPAFISIPPASLGHTILAQPVAYILPALALIEAYCWLTSRNLPLVIRHSSFVILTIVFLTTNAFRDLRDYFGDWPHRGMVRFLYRADCREAARYLDAHPEVTDVAISSVLAGPWDRLALEVDTHRDDVAVRLFNPERALVWVAEDVPSAVLLTSFPRPAPPIEELLKACTDPPEVISPHLTLYALPPIRNPQSAIHNPQFANGLELVEARWTQDTVLLTTWLVAAPLDLPPIPIIANPPPPGVYAGPRLAVFTHVFGPSGEFLAGDDGLWVDPVTLQPGDRFIQLHRFQLPSNASAEAHTVEIGLYDPLTGERWDVLDPAGKPVGDRVLLAEGGEQ